MRYELLEKFAADNLWPAYRLTQARESVFNKGISSWDEATSLPAAARKQLKENISILSFTPEKTLRSKTSSAQKALLRLPDGPGIETALIEPLPGSWSVCVSSQAGCPVGCRFCATGAGGFIRNLAAEEISDQALFWKQLLKKEKIPGDISTVVYMGMGEPFLNYGPVSQSMRTLSNPAFFGMSQRRLSVSTAGHIPGILRFADDFPQANLAVSLHSVDDAERNGLVPFNRTFPLSRLKTALAEYIRKTNKKVFIEYTLIPGVNETPEHAASLAAWLKGIKGWNLLHVNLISCNTTGPSSPAPGPIQESEDRRRLRLFYSRLKAMGISTTIRKSLGGDIQGACGQLVLHKT